VCLLVWLSSQVRPAVDRAVAWYRGPGPSPVEQLQQEWVDNEITDEEFERRLELALDERAVVIREAVEEIDGVGTERSALLRIDSRASKRSGAPRGTNSPRSTTSVRRRRLTSRHILSSVFNVRFY